MNVLIVDYGMGNLASVKRALEECGAEAFISNNPAAIENASKIILPGVGSFALAMENIKKSGWFDALQQAVLQKHMPLLGICLGMQLLAEEGEEHGKASGLGFIPGQILKIPAIENIRVPHVGWNEIAPHKSDPLLFEIDSGTDFYFVHSYYFKASNENDVLAYTSYGMDFPSIVRRGNVWGTQFHPEKSGLPGFQLIRNFLSVKNHA